MLRDARRVAPGAKIQGDVCVIGAGAAGITVALELAAAGHEVVLLEAGGRREEASARHALRGEVIEEPSGSGSRHPPLEMLRQRRLGGTTGTWGGRCIPLDPVDFEARDHIPHSGWPVSREDLDPFYRRAQVFCEAGRFEYTTDEALPGAAPFLVPPGVAASITDRKLLRYSRPTDFGRAYDPALKASRRIFLLHHASVVSLELRADGTAVSGALVASDPGREFRVESSHYVVAGGGLETTRLLLASSRRAGLRLGDGHESLGRFYMTHLDGFVGSLRFKDAAPTAASSYELSRDGIYCRRLIGPTPRTLREQRLLNFSAVLYPPAAEDPGHGDPLLSAYALAKEAIYRTRSGLKARREGLSRRAPLPIAAHVRNVLRNPGRFAPFAATWVRGRWLASRRLPSFLSASPSGEYRLLFSAEQSPSASSRVTLADEEDAFGVPRLRVRWYVSPSDHESILRTLGIVREEFHRFGLGTAVVPTDAESLRAEIGGAFLGGTHAMGTARMSSSPKQGVVDGRCRIHGVPNLHVASSAVFPTGGFAAPTLTIVALAVRIASGIIADLRPFDLPSGYRTGGETASPYSEGLQ